ncbi:MAG: UMP kinase [Rickettsiaceae bacterium H1]|nr:UMP kinase [Rickettsiaceae bacterium H1]
MDKKYSRILLKVSGEGMMGQKKFGHDFDQMTKIAYDIKEVHELGIQICLVVGGGNIFRGVDRAVDMDKATSDYMGMLATVINALALQNAIENIGLQCRVLSAINMSTVSEPYIRRKAVRHLEKGRVVIFAAGTGNPFFTTDTAAVLRAIEMNCDAILKGTQVDGVYSADPNSSSDAVRYDSLSYMDVLSQNLKVMDSAAISLARDNKMPIIVFNLHHRKGLSSIVTGKGKYTMIMSEVC